MTTVHHLKITLKHTQPSIWRELLVPSEIRLDRLHQVIQIVMGWQNCHMHEFNNGQRGPGEERFGPASKGPALFALPFDDDVPQRDEAKATLLDLAPAKGSKFVYWYDFGDDWIHDIAVKSVGEPRPDAATIICLKAAGACPPDDCGGIFGYENLLQVLSDPQHEDFVDLSEWIGGDWDAEHYDIVAVNRALAALQRRWSKAPRKKK